MPEDPLKNMPPSVREGYEKAQRAKEGKSDEDSPIYDAFMGMADALRDQRAGQPG